MPNWKKIITSGSNAELNQLNATSITANTISSSGAITASNLSGINTGDQDLSFYIQNSQTSSMSVATSVTASFIASIHGGTF